MSQPTGRDALIAHLVAGGATLALAESLADSYERRCAAPAAPASTRMHAGASPNVGVSGYVVRRRGRPYDKISRQLDAHYLHAALRDQGMTWRDASAAISALINIGEGELARAAREISEPLDGHGTDLALCAVAAQARWIAARLDDPAVNARAELERLPAEARAWIEQAIARLGR